MPQHLKDLETILTVGLQLLLVMKDNHILKDIFDIANFTPDLIESSYAYRTIIDGKIIDRKRDFEEFLESLDGFIDKNNRFL